MNESLPRFVGTQRFSKGLDGLLGQQFKFVEQNCPNCSFNIIKTTTSNSSDNLYWCLLLYQIADTNTVLMNMIFCVALNNQYHLSNKIFWFAHEFILSFV